MGFGFGVWGLGFGVWGLGFGVWGLGFGVWGLGFGVCGLGLASHDLFAGSACLPTVLEVMAASFAWGLLSPFLAV